MAKEETVIPRLHPRRSWRTGAVVAASVLVVVVGTMLCPVQRAASGITPTPTGMNPAPTGPPTPTGGWTAVFADDFNEPLGDGPGQDPLWYPNQPGVPVTGLGWPNNPSVELEVYAASQVSVSGGDLNLTAQPVGDGYLSGMANTSGPGGWTWTPGGGQTMAFEVVAKFPTGAGLFNACWTASEDGWTDERDFVEGHPGDRVNSSHIYDTDPKAQQESITTLPFDPSAAFHRYTYVVNPNGSWQLYIDGQRQSWAGGGPEPDAKTPMELLLDYAVIGDTDLASSTFSIASVAVYEDTPHASQHVSRIAIAPGTTISTVTAAGKR
jgi:beta-glucanase (GH16 family)